MFIVFSNVFASRDKLGLLFAMCFLFLEALGAIFAVFYHVVFVFGSHKANLCCYLLCFLLFEGPEANLGCYLLCFWGSWRPREQFLLLLITFSDIFCFPRLI